MSGGEITPPGVLQKKNRIPSWRETPGTVNFFVKKIVLLRILISDTEMAKSGSSANSDFRKIK